MGNCALREGLLDEGYLSLPFEGLIRIELGLSQFPNRWKSFRYLETGSWRCSHT